jgi:nicotinate-nucleotide pyrophosphorylase (carboxylating)
MDRRPEERLWGFLAEDGAGWRDVSSGVVAGETAAATVRSREAGVAAGVAEAVGVFDRLDVDADPAVDDGERVAAGDELLSVAGDAEGLLRGERLALNLLGSMSGVATATRRAVDRAGGVRVAATRKTTPGYRDFEKRAVRLGGGDTHRYGLADAVLLKENHIDIVGLETAVERARERASFTTKIEVEAETRAEAVRAADAGADVVLLDNMSPGEAADCVDALPEEVLTEASGGITAETVGAYADTGVDVVSMGSLTHSANWLDVTMLVD